MEVTTAKMIAKRMVNPTTRATIWGGTVSFSAPFSPVAFLTSLFQPPKNRSQTMVSSSSAGISRAVASRVPELESFFAQLCEQAEMIKEFPPSPGRVAGPLLRVYRLVSYTIRK